MTKSSYMLLAITVVVSVIVVSFIIYALQSDLALRYEKAALQVSQAGSRNYSAQQQTETAVAVPEPDIRPILSRAAVWGELIEVKPPPPKPPAPPNLKKMAQGLKVESTIIDDEGKVTAVIIFDNANKKRDLYGLESRVRSSGLVVEKFTDRGVVLRYKNTNCHVG